MRVDVYSRHDAYVGTIGARQLLSFIWTDCLNGEDTVDITTTFPLKEGYRIVWQDLNGSPHEHVCQDPKGASAAGLPIYSDTALNSICELFGDYIEDKRPYGYSFQRALEVCLEPTRWDVGTVDQPGTVSSGLTFYHTDCRTALNDILACGGELETSITVGASGVTHRRVSILKHRAEANDPRRSSYGKDINSITRTEHWGAITACYGYGKGVETDAGGYGRKLTFGEINNGKDYVEDAEALKLYGRPDGKGGLKHVFGKYENSSCEDAQQLKDETQDYLDQHKTPGVTYEADVVDLVAMGRPWEGVGVGDDTQMVDSSFEPTLRCQGRVTKLVIDILAKTQKVTLGNVTESIADILQQQQQQITHLQNQSGSWDAVAGTTPAFLQQLIDSLNEQFNLNGMSYMHVSFENGFIFSSVPLDEDGRPTATGGTAMQLCSLGFRIAAGTKADGSYDWRTFGTGNGFVADWITTGTLLAGLVKAGVLSDVKEKNYWDMETGEFRLSADATVDGKTVGEMTDDAQKAAVEAAEKADQQRLEEAKKYAEQKASSAGSDAKKAAKEYVDALDESLGQKSVFDRLTNYGKSQGIYLENGNLYINGTYIKSGVVDAALVNAGIMTDKSGKNSWDLESGDLSVTDGTIKIAGSWNTVEISPENGLVITDEYGDVLFRAERDSEDTSNIEVMRIKFGENVLATLNANTNQDCTLYMDVWDAKSVPDANLSASLRLSPKSIEMTSNRRVSVGGTRSVFGIRITDAGIQYLNSSYGQWVGLEKYVKDRNQSHDMN